MKQSFHLHLSLIIGTMETMNNKQIQRMMNLDLLGELDKGKNMRSGCCKLQLGPRQKLFVHISPLFSACIVPCPSTKHMFWQQNPLWNCRFKNQFRRYVVSCAFSGLLCNGHCFQKLKMEFLFQAHRIVFIRQGHYLLILMSSGVIIKI